MNVLNNNIRFNYLYRDSGNFKQFGSIIFSNPNNRSIESITLSLRNKLFDGEYFYTHIVGISSLPNHTQDNNGLWHEFENVEFTKSEPTEEQNIDLFLERFSVDKLDIGTSLKAINRL